MVFTSTSPLVRLAVAVLAIALVAVALVLGFVVVLILVPVIAVLALVLRWHLRRQAGRFAGNATIIKGVAYDVTVEPGPADGARRLEP